MQTGDPGIEQRFLDRRSRVLRAAGAWFGSFALGIVALIVAKQRSEAALDALMPLFVCALAALGVRLWWTLRRHWRCPACEARWRFDGSLASAHWNHCGECGAALRVMPRQRPHELRGALDAACGGASHADLVARLRRNRRLGGAAATALGAAGIAAYGWIASLGLGETAEQVAAATAVGLATAVAVVGSRCPRCRSGIVGGVRGHCQRCGFSAAAVDSRTGR